ncbi:sigma-70 family RNA polymerase sigma factor [Methylosinus sp. H3A]|uniref:sigma-70 family RNA polymerase sigma factor n=1 Tax=Methylosinus sp. H3A TaxID=2785786 RepID=UPI0018C2A7D8|nr:sigma-70 family RNA polymerase sigma factor [Methylosinus sp. H3A]MBG0810725.1 sigma-70 family RNA polymerase sigma factor [Methylosinus sp. H3A]
MSSSEKVLDKLYQDYAPALRRFARRRVGAQESEDIVQDIYLHALQRVDVTKLESPRAYLFRIAANLSVDAIRRDRIRSRYVEEAARAADQAERSNSGDTIAMLMELQKLCASLERLPPLLREIFLLKRLEHLTSAEIATRVGISVRTVERLLARANDEIRRDFRL